MFEKIAVYQTLDFHSNLYIKRTNLLINMKLIVLIREKSFKTYSRILNEDLLKEESINILNINM